MLIASETGVSVLLVSMLVAMSKNFEKSLLSPELSKIEGDLEEYLI